MKRLGVAIRWTLKLWRGARSDLRLYTLVRKLGGTYHRRRDKIVIRIDSPGGPVPRSKP